MADIIPFPDDYTRLVQAGKQAENSGKLKEAYQVYSQAYKVNPNLSLNLIMARLSFDLEDPDQALFVLEDYLDDYVKAYQLGQDNLEGLALYLRGLAEENRYEDFIALVDGQLVDYSYDQIEADLNLDLKDFMARYQGHLKKLNQDLFSLGQFPPSQQIDIASAYYAFDRDDYFQACQIALPNRYVHPITKTALIQGLLVKDFDQTISYPFLKETYQVDLSQLAGVKEDEFGRQLEDMAEDLFQADPTKVALVKNEGWLDYLILYPLHRKLITDPASWVLSYQGYFDLEASGGEESDQGRLFSQIQRLKLSDS